MADGNKVQLLSNNSRKNKGLNTRNNKLDNNNRDNNKKTLDDFIRKVIGKYDIYQLLHNVILATDSYKLTHWTMYKQLGITGVYSYLEARSNSKFDNTVWFGLHYFLKQLEGAVITEELVNYCKPFVDAHMGPGYYNFEMWKHIATEHQGKLPIRIKAVPEGTVVPVGNVLLTIENTDPKCIALVNHLESFLLQVWYPSTVATVSKCVKDTIRKHILNTIEEEDLPTHLSALNFMLHDFGYRGTSSTESAGLGGLAHLANFWGTDTIAGLLMGMKYYGVTGPAVNGYSVPATEHSIMTSLGKKAEFTLIRTLVDENPFGVLSMVMDSYNIFKALKYLCDDKKGIANIVKERTRKQLESNGKHHAPPTPPTKIVIRPDSGEPSEIIPELLRIIEESDAFKYDPEVEDPKEKALRVRHIKGKNGQTIKMLPACFGILWGDGMNPNSVDELLKNIVSWGWGVTNFIFGMGGGLLQKVDRDTQSWAFKCCANTTDTSLNKRLIMQGGSNELSKWKPVFKDPVTSSGTKKSKMGKLLLIKDEKNNKNQTKYKTIQSLLPVDGNNSTFKINPEYEFNINNDLLEVVFENGDVKCENPVLINISQKLETENTVQLKVKPLPTYKVPNYNNEYYNNEYLTKTNKNAKKNSNILLKSKPNLTNGEDVMWYNTTHSEWKTGKINLNKSPELKNGKKKYHMKNEKSYYISNNGQDVAYTNKQSPISEEKLFKLNKNKNIRNTIKKSMY